jgi:hypothetical protein
VEPSGYISGADILGAIIPAYKWVSCKGRSGGEGEGCQCEANLYSAIRISVWKSLRTEHTKHLARLHVSSNAPDPPTFGDGL